MFNLIKDWLDRLAKENEKSFGNGRLDCCDLNKTKNTNTQASMNTIKK
ncbi:MAG: LDCC motif putative metal-binding protein [Sedimentibacter sp.]